MDIVSHGLWGALLAKSANKRLQKKRSPQKHRWDPLLAGFWGVFPDLVAFTPAFILFGGGFLSGHLDLRTIPRVSQTDPTSPQLAIFQITSLMYSITHSIVVFSVIFFSIVMVRKFLLKKTRAPIWEMSAWLLHILMDIPTHSYQFYPTPAFWPLFGWRFNGISWATPWVFALNFGLLLLGYFVVRDREEKKTFEPAFVVETDSSEKD